MPENDNKQAAGQLLDVRMEYTPKVNYAMSLNGVRYFDFIDLKNTGDEPLHQVRVTLTGEMVETAETLLEVLPAGETVHVTQLEIKPNIDKLSALTESIETQVLLQVGTADAQLFTQSYALRLLAFDEWPGAGVLPEMLAAFVTPNATAVPRVNVNAAKNLEQLTGSSALDEYQTQDPNRVRAQVAAIYEALRAEGIVYSAPPASFEKDGQRVRLADRVLTEKLATCMDSTLLFASCMEAAGIHPLLVLFKGHIFVGAWLTNNRYPQMVGDDASFLLKASADGINEVVLVETTCICSSEAIGFEQAVQKAEATLRADEQSFRLFVDVARCRLNGIRPIPLQLNGGQWVVPAEGLQHDKARLEVKEQQTIDVAMTDDTASLTRQQVWERKLLDISLRNALINIRMSSRIIPFVSFQLETLEDHLQQDEEFTVMPSPIAKQEPGEWGIYDSSLYKDKLEKQVVDGLQSKTLISYLTDTELTNVQKNLFRASRTALEENGANSLFLVMGLMKWFETEKSVRPRYAPILLMPVDIVRKGSNGYVLRRRDEDLILNTTLVEMLKQQYGINLGLLDPLPEDEHGVDVKKILTVVRSTLKDHKGWDVLEESLLGLFSFNKFVMWNDIHNNADALRKNPVIESLIEKKIVGLVPAEGAQADAAAIDRVEEPGDFAIPMDVDSSQMEAVIDSGKGQSFILYGPPGTGKSQTITNMIANALYHDKRVLFVAEKMAALSVVQKRLKKVGLEPFCLEMHSNKATKTHLLDQLDMALNVTHYQKPEEFAVASKELFEQRKKLIGYMDALHRKHANGLSLYDCITRYIDIDGDEVQLPADQVGRLNAQTVAAMAEGVAGLDTVFAITGHPSASPLRGLTVRQVSGEAAAKLEQTLKALQTALPQAKDAASGFATQYALDVPQTVGGVRSLAALIDRWLALLGRDRRNRQLHQQIAGQYTENIFSRNVAQMKQAWKEVEDKWFLPRFFARRSFVGDLKQFNPYVKKESVPELIANLEKYEAEGTAVDEEAKAFSKTCRISAAQLLSVSEQQQADIEATGTRLKTLLTLLDADTAAFAFDIDDLQALSDCLPGYLANTDKLRDWYQWSLRKDDLKKQHAGAVIAYILDNGAPGSEAALAMQKGIYHQLAMQCIDAEPQLQLFNGLLFEDQIKKYRQLAAQFSELTKKMLYYHLASKIPSLTIEAANSSEIGILKRYIASKGRAATIRKIIDQIPTLLPKLCPCMLMSPLSVAQYIDLEQEKFDLVIFDEASQMPTSEAVGAIARGKALIVVGDPKQMPPTSFFTNTATSDDEMENEDMESILDDCITLSMPSRYLTWHYRSKHESLIAFSNQEYYEGKLYTFPSVDDRVSKVTLRPVDGTYDYGRTRSNKAEAEAITAEVIRRLQLPQDQQHSLGVVAFSKVQQNLIEDMLTEELTKHPDLEKLAYDVEEPIFIKNLENVQGDERDIILFSVGYGPDKSGKVSMNFGPLNNAGGERRLNVAVSRARYEMVVFSTLKPEQIDLSRSKAKGVEGLKAFLEFADRGRLAVNAQQVKVAQESELIDDLAVELERQGYKTDKQVGRSHFKIDLAVLDPRNPQTYIMGIMTDGKGYYETKTQRDREICQPSVLKMLSWNIMRVWSVDWFENRQRVVERIVSVLKDLEAGKEAAEEPAPKLAKFVAADMKPVEAVNPHAIPYEAAPVPRITRLGDLEYVLTQGDRVKAFLQKVVEVEQPVTLGYLCKRVVQTWGLTRVTPRLQTMVRQQLDFVFIDTHDLDSPYYWMNRDAAEGYDKYRVDSGRDITEVPLIEIANAMRYAVEQQVSLSIDDLERQVSKMMSFGRMGPKVKGQVEKALEMLMLEHVLKLDNGMVSLDTNR